jgi:hypothetical protein
MWQDTVRDTYTRILQEHNRLFYNVALSIDMTARNMQEDVKKKGLPWTTHKGFDTFCPTRQVSLSGCYLP